MKIRTTKWVLVADKDREIRERVARVLTDHFKKEVTIIEARDGVEAMAKIANQAFHLIITNLDLPRKNGGEVVESARSNAFNDTTPLIMFSLDGTIELERHHKFINGMKLDYKDEELVSVVRNLFNIGSTEKMISASIFNSLLDSSVRFLKEALKRKDFTLGEFKLKPVGVAQEAEYAAIITVYIGKVSNTFSVLCSKETLESIRDGSEKVSGTTLDVISRSLGYVILKHVLTQCGIIDHNEVHTKDISQDPAELTEKKGIIVPIQADGIDYKIFATTKGLIGK